MEPYLTDPRTKEKSVSLTMLILALLLVLVANILQLAKVTEDIGSSMELFYAAAGLYWGRKFTSAKGESLEEKQETQEKE